MRHLQFLYILLILVLVYSCGNTAKKEGIDEMKVVATATNIGDAKLISCDFTKLNDNDKVNLPLSYFVEDLKIVKLQTSDEALVGNSFVTVTDNYILVRNNKSNPYKLFDKSGKFLSTIGAYGQGPNEYLNVYDDFFDEKNDRIYILPWQTDKLLVFDTEGNAQKPIPLKYRVPKGKFHINTKDETVSVFLLPFRGIPVVAWTQDFEGNMIDSIPAGPLAVEPDFSNEVYSNKNTEAFDCSLFTFYDLHPDSLYHYNATKNSLEPVFTLDFKSLERKIHSYAELPNHFLGDVTVEKKLSNYLSTTEKPEYFIVDKNTLKGAYFNLYNDSLGNLPVDWPSFNNGYFVWNVEPSDLAEKLTEHLKNSLDISSEERESLEKLIAEIDVNNNNYIIYGKLKH